MISFLVLSVTVGVIYTQTDNVTVKSDLLPNDYDEDEENVKEAEFSDEDSREDEGPFYPPNPPRTSSFTTETTHMANPNNANSVKTTKHVATTQEATKTDQQTTESPFLTCPEDWTQLWDNQTLVWPETSKGELAVSHPLCINEKLIINTRLCAETGWEDEPECASIQTTSLNPCPSDLTPTKDGQYCYTLLDSTTFPPNCPYPEVVSWDEYKSLDMVPPKPIWMPVTRTESQQYGFDIYRFIEPTHKYKTPFQICTQSCVTLFYDNETFLDKPCLIYHNSSHVEAVRCDLEYAALCVYAALQRQQRSLCSQSHARYCKQGTYNPTEICYCKTDNIAVGDEVLAEFLEPYQNLLFQNVSCRFGLTNTYDETNPFRWVNSQQPLGYTFWAPDADFRNPTGILTDRGWQLVNDNSFDCSIYRLTDLSLSERVSEMLDFNINEGSFHLEVVNDTQLLHDDSDVPLIYCFTDADATSILYRFRDFSESYSTDERYKINFLPLDLDKSGPGNYWCEAFSYPNLTVIRSSARIMDYSGEYAVLLTLNRYDQKLGNYPLTSDNLETIQNLLRNEMPSDSSFYPRVFRIHGIDEYSQTMNVTFHLTSEAAGNTEEEFESLKIICEKQSMFEFIDFRSVHYCPNSTTTHNGIEVVWGRTDVDGATYPSNGYCVTPQGDLVKRACVGGFVEGAYWSDVPDCTLYPQSPLTDSIVGLLEEEDPLNQLRVISEEYQQFNTLDFVLSVRLLNLTTAKLDVEAVAGIVSNLAEIPRTTLLSAELNFRSTDLLLKTVDSLLDQSPFCEHNNPNFALKIVNLTEVVGFNLNQCTSNYTNCVITPVTNASFDSFQDLYAAVRLSSTLYNQITAYSLRNTTYSPKMVLTVHYGSQLFVELDDHKYSDLVLGVSLPGFEEEFQGPVTIYYFHQTSSLLYNCSFWQFENASSGSWTVDGTVNCQNAVACQYYHLTNFALFDPSTNHLQRDWVRLSDQCNYSDVDMQNCAEIRSEELEDVQTDSLLVAVEEADSGAERTTQKRQNSFGIVRNQDSTYNAEEWLDWTNRSCAKLSVCVHYPPELFVGLPAVARHVTLEDLADLIEMTFVEALLPNGFLESLTEVVGFNLNQCTSNYTNCVITPVTNASFDSFQDLYAAVRLSSTLYNQITAYSLRNTTYSPKMVLTVYYGSQLFVELDDHKYSDLVLGVSLPGFEEEFQGPVTIYYFHPTSSLLYNCSFWEFENASSGSWTVDGTVNCQNAVACQYYHLTNFALFDPSIHHPQPDWVRLSDQFNYSDVDTQNCAEIGSEELEDEIDRKPIDPLLVAVEEADSGAERTTQKRQNSSGIVRNQDNTYNAEEWLDWTNRSCTKLTVCVHYPPELFVGLPAVARHVTLEDLADLIEMTVVEALLPNGFLESLDGFLANFNDTHSVVREHVILVTASKLDSTHLKGITVKDGEVSCITEEEQSVLPFDVLVAFTPNLRKQIRRFNSRILIGIFYSEHLFPGRVAKPVVEVLMPELTAGKLEGEIVIQYSNFQSGGCSFWNGSTWIVESRARADHRRVSCRYSHVTHFALVVDAQNITTDLEQILESNLTSLEKLKQVDRILNLDSDLVAVDVFLISRILNDSLNYGVPSKVISRIVSALFRVPQEVLVESQRKHAATDLVLYAVDQMSRMVAEMEEHHSNFSVIVRGLDNLTGMVLYNCQMYTCSFEFLEHTVNVTDYSLNGSVTAMVTFNEQLLAQIRRTTKQPRIAISVYYSNVLFNEINSSRRATTKIFGVIFPNFEADNLEGNVTVVNQIGHKSGSDQCAYWRYSPVGQNSTMGMWMNESTNQRAHSMAICSYSHVTHFGMLLSNSDRLDEDPILDFVTDVGCVLSLFGILVILVTALLFKRWRRNTGNQILIHFSIAISLTIITLYVSVYVKKISYGSWCTVTGAVLHYAILSECGWMLTVAILQFKRFVEVLGGPPKYVLIKALICGWVFPLFPVLCVVLIDPHNYEKGLANLCYPSNLGLYLGVWLPVLLILTTNLIIFVIIMYNIFHKKTEYMDATNQEILFQWRLALLLFFMLGLNMIFGFLAQIKDDKVFVYLYSITASMQGFVLFLFFILFNKSTRLLYSQTVKQWFYSKGIFKVRHAKSNG